MWIWTTDKQIQLVVKARLEFKKFRWQGQYFDLSAIRVVIDFFFSLVALLDHLGRIAPRSHRWVVCKLLPTMTCLASIFPCNQDCVPVLYSKIDHLGFRLTTIKLKLFYKVVYCLSLGSTWCHKHATVEAHAVRYSFPTHYRTRAS